MSIKANEMQLNSSGFELTRCANHFLFFALLFPHFSSTQMYDIDKKGIGKVMEEVQDYMSGRSIHLSYDIDSMDPFYAPSTGTAVRGGLTFREVTL
jgi:hypothetical protein